MRLNLKFSKDEIRMGTLEYKHDDMLRLRDIAKTKPELWRSFKRFISFAEEYEQGKI